MAGAPLHICRVASWWCPLCSRTRSLPKPIHHRSAAHASGLETGAGQACKQLQSRAQVVLPKLSSYPCEKS